MADKVPHLMAYLMEEYQRQGETPAGQDPDPSALDELDEHLSLEVEDDRDTATVRKYQEVARFAIEDFCEFCVRRLHENPPVTVSAAEVAEGLGLRLADQTLVCTRKDGTTQGEGTMEPAGDVPITKSGGGMEGTRSVPVTGKR